MSPLARAPYSPRRKRRLARTRSARRRVHRARRAHHRGVAGVGGEAREACTGAGQAQRLLARREGRRRQGRRRLRRRPLADRAQHRRQQRAVARGRLQAVLQQPERADVRRPAPTVAHPDWSCCCRPRPPRRARRSRARTRTSPACSRSTAWARSRVGSTQTWNTWQIGKAGFGSGPSMLTAYVVKGTAPALIPDAGLELISNRVTVPFTISAPAGCRQRPRQRNATVRATTNADARRHPGRHERPHPLPVRAGPGHDQRVHRRLRQRVAGAQGSGRADGRCRARRREDRECQRPGDLRRTPLVLLLRRRQAR